MTRLIFGLLAAVAIAGCGAAGANDPGNTPDGGIGCEMLITVPGQTQVGDTVAATGSVDSDAIVVYRWTVTHGGAPVMITPLESDSSRISFVAEEAGLYELVLKDDSINDCRDTDAVVNVIPADTEPARLLIRAVPPQGAGIAPQVIPVDIYPGIDYDLGELSLTAGFLARGTVRDDAGDPMAAYLRAQTAASVFSIESFATADGRYAMPFPSSLALYDLLIVPADPGRAAHRIADVSPQTLADIEVPAGIEVTGSVRDGAGDPVAGARVQIVAGGVPSAVAVSDATGQVVFRSPPGPVSQVTVVPPEGAGLFELEAVFDGGATVATGSTLDVAFSAAAGGVTVAPSALSHAGDAAASARAVWMARPTQAAGEVAIDGAFATQVIGTAVVGSVADASGQMSPVTLPVATYDVVLEPEAQADGGASITVVDLFAGAPPTLALTEAAIISGNLARADGDPLAGARITATPTGIVAKALSGAATATTAADGTFSLAVIGGVDYRLEASPSPGAMSPRVARAMAAPASGQQASIDDWVVPQGVAITATLSAPGAGNLAGTYVTVRCLACAEDPSWVAPEAVTDSRGDLILILPHDL